MSDLHPATKGFTDAERYERGRPSYPQEAVDTIVREFDLRGGRTVLDLAAGTGKLTRLLVPSGANVIAVEPIREMREQIAGVVALAGTAERIPLADDYVDAVTVAQAFHWFELEMALAEMHRVLRPGGGFALLWNEWDFPELNAIVDRLRQRPGRDDEAYARLKGTPLFANFEEPSFRHAERVDVETVLERVSSISAVITASAENRAAALTDVRSLLGAGTIDFPMLTLVIAADRV